MNTGKAFLVGCLSLIMVLFTIGLFVLVLYLQKKNSSQGTTSPPSGGGSGPSTNWIGSPPEGMTWDSLAMVANWGDCLPCYEKQGDGTCVNKYVPNAPATGTGFDYPYKNGNYMKTWGQTNYAGCPKTDYTRPPNRPVPDCPSGTTTCNKGSPGYCAYNGNTVSTYCISQYNNCDKPDATVAGVNLWNRGKGTSQCDNSSGGSGGSSSSPDTQDPYNPIYR